MGLRAALRLLRALGFAFACMAITVTGHQLAGGPAVSPSAAVIGALALCIAAWSLGRGEWPRGALMIMMLLGQTGLHALFLVSAAPGATHGTGAGHELRMLATHLAVAVLAGWWLRRGEAACWGLVRLAESLAGSVKRTVLGHLARMLDVPATDGGAGPRRPRRDAVVADGVLPALLCRCAPRRGPPRVV